MLAPLLQALTLRLTPFLLAWLGLLAVLATPMLAWHQFRGELQPSSVAFSFILAAVALPVVWSLRRAVYQALQGLMRFLARQADMRWMVWMILLGLALRLLWVAVYPAVPRSDGATYLYLAGQLQAGLAYESDGTRANWPPGYPMFLMPWLYLPVAPSVAVVLSNLALYVGTIWVTFRLATQAGGPRAARLATLLLALWPTHVANAGLPEKENLVILLLPLAFWLYLRGREHGRLLPGGTLAAGLVLGAAALAQPSIQFFVAVFLVYEVANRSRPRVALAALGLLVLGMALTIAPWTLRNLQVLGKPVLIATNGGDVLYRANNPLATGGWTPRGEVDLSHLNELDRDREGARLAKAWIAQHPADFLRLSLWKQVLFLGDDSVGVFNSLSRGVDAPPRAYLVWKAVANAYWMMIWLLVLVALWALRGRLVVSPILSALVLAYAYFYVIHSVFESTSKYHTPAMALLAVVLATLLCAWVREADEALREPDARRRA